MKRYMAFSGEDFYPNGGMSDFRGSFDELDQAIERAKADHEETRYREPFTPDWAHVYDCDKNEIIWKIDDDPLRCRT